jgi:hypothetical protein
MLPAAANKRSFNSLQHTLPIGMNTMGQSEWPHFPKRARLTDSSMPGLTDVDFASGLAVYEADASAIEAGANGVFAPGFLPNATFTVETLGETIFNLTKASEELTTVVENMRANEVAHELRIAYLESRLIGELFINSSSSTEEYAALTYHRTNKRNASPRIPPHSYGKLEQIIIDSAASSHMMKNKAEFYDTQTCDTTVRLADGYRPLK